MFSRVLIYICISLVLFLIAYPLTYRLEKLHLGRRRMPDSIAALITILAIVGVVSGLFSIIIPPLVTEVRFLANLNFHEVMHNILAQFPAVKQSLLKLGDERDLEQNLVHHASKLFNPANISLAVNNIFHYVSALLGGTLCVLFITFFLLKDEQIIKQTMLTLTPSGFENDMGEVFATSKRMLSKYFAALFLDMFIVGLAVMTILTMLDIRNALLIAFVAGILNVIPYIGSVITMIIAIFLGVSGCISAGAYDLIGPTINKIFFALLSINLTDALIVQPLLFSKSVKAHPLEVFIVTLMAAIVGGIPGMIVALPAYTLIRIVAKEFLTSLKFFRKISENIDE